MPDLVLRHLAHQTGQGCARRRSPPFRRSLRRYYYRSDNVGLLGTMCALRLSVQSVLATTAEYIPRKPDETVLHRVVRDHLEDFLQEARERSRDGEGMPDFIVQELRKFLTCGSLAGGFARFKCQDCGHERLLAFSCKRRGICPSCAGRRMAEKAAHLVDSVFPIVPVRQWVLSLPFDLRYMMAWDHRLTRRILRAFSRELEKYYRKKAKKRGVARGRGGAVTVIQRAGGALNLNVHFHTASIDGVFEQKSDGDLRFQRVFAPTTDEVKDLAKRVRKRVLRILGRKKISLRDADGIFEDSFSEEHPALAAAASASIQQLVAFGERAGRNVLRMFALLRDREDMLRRVNEDKVVFVNESLIRHSTSPNQRATADIPKAPVPARDRDRLERLIRYLLRPPMAQGRLKELSDGRIALMMKSRWDDGTTHIVFQPKELIEKLVAIIPHPQTNQLIYRSDRSSAIAPVQTNVRRRTNVFVSSIDERRLPAYAIKMTSYGG